MGPSKCCRNFHAYVLGIKKRWLPWFWRDDEIDEHWYFLDCQVIECVIWWVGGTTLQMSLSVFLLSDEK